MATLHETPVRFGGARAGRIMGCQMAAAHAGAAMLLAAERLNRLLRRRNEAV